MNLRFRTLVINLVLAIVVLETPILCHAQNAEHDYRGTAADYQRMDQQWDLVKTGVVRDKVKVHWQDDGRLWYQVNVGVDQFEYVVVDIAKGTKKVVAKPPKTETKNLTAIKASVDQGGETHVEFKNESDITVRLIWIDREKRRQSYGTLDPGQSTNQHTFVGHVWLVESEDRAPLALFVATNNDKIIITNDSKVELRRDSRPEIPDHVQKRAQRLRPTSPDGKWRVFIRSYNVYLRNLENDEEKQLTEDGKSKFFYSNHIEWAPDSKKFIVEKTKPEQTHRIHMIESAPKDQLQPKLHKMQYLKPGDDVRRKYPALFHVDAEKQIEVSTELFYNPFQIRDGSWTDDSREYRFVYNQRGHQLLRYVGIDGKSGRVRTIINELSETFVEYARKYFLRTVPGTDELIWMSERDGWNHLYLIDAKTGNVKNQITKGEWVVRDVQRVDMEKRRIYFRASGWYPEQDPYFVHYGHVDFDGKNLVKMTCDNGTHSIEYAPDRATFVDTFSRVDMPPIRQLRRTQDGKLLLELETANASTLIEKGWRAPIPFSAKGRDGQTDIHGVVYLPSQMDPKRQYPVIEYIYAGPHSSFVPKRFSIYRSEKAMAELGFIVVQIDGMGTSNRSKAFHDICWKNLGDSGFPDRIAWMKAAQKKFPQMDLSRVGIFGGSAGGQSALRALLAHGDFYKAAVSDCGCHDNRMDKIWWNELWMSWPIGPHYEEQSNVTNAHKLQGKLLLIVGELDRNVDPASTMQVVDALIKADKDFELLIVPGAGHGVGSGKYGTRRTRDFFVRTLIGAEPRGQ